MKAKLIIIASLLVLSACSSTQKAYQQNIKLYFSSKVDNVLSNDDIKAAPYDLIYVKNGERSVATMALAFIENGQYKWLSKDDAMLITVNGRLIRTLGFEKNLTYLNNVNEDPISMGSNIQPTKALWSRRIDTEFQDYGALLQSTFSVSRGTSLVIQGLEFSVNKVQEKVLYTNAMNDKETWTNTFWFHHKTNQLIKSSQTMAPNLDSLELTYVSRALRLLETQND